MMIAAYVAVGFGVAGIHASAAAVAQAKPASIAAPSTSRCSWRGAGALVQPLSGDLAAHVVADTQPVKLAAMEGQFDTERAAPLRVGGMPDEASGTTRYALEIPGGLSWLAYGDWDAVVRGLTEVPARDRPPVAIVHIAFQIMVAAGRNDWPLLAGVVRVAGRQAP